MAFFLSLSVCLNPVYGQTWNYKAAIYSSAFWASPRTTLRCLLRPEPAVHDPGLVPVSNVHLQQTCDGL